MAQEPVTVAVRSEAWVLAAWLLRSWVRIPLWAWMFVLVLLCCVVLCVIRAIRQTDKQKKRGEKGNKEKKKVV
jgi:Flp pilus assembly protein TadB